MASGEEKDNLERPSQDQIVDFILNWRQLPRSEDLVLKPNEITSLELVKRSGMGSKWCKSRLKSLWEAELCSRRAVKLRNGGLIYVYTFPEKVSKFSS